jgi:hypothetical protein
VLSPPHLAQFEAGGLAATRCCQAWLLASCAATALFVLALLHSWCSKAAHEWRALLDAACGWLAGWLSCSGSSSNSSSRHGCTVISCSRCLWDGRSTGEASCRRRSTVAAAARPCDCSRSGGCWCWRCQSTAAAIASGCRSGADCVSALGCCCCCCTAATGCCCRLCSHLRDA